MERDNVLKKTIDWYLERVESFNFTGHKTREKFEVLNIEDSLLPAKLGLLTLSKGQKVLDIGTGGGFPGVPLAIYFPETEFVLMDSVGKKLKLIDELCGVFGLKNIKTIHGRFEDVAHDPLYREGFDVVTSKAVANWSTLMEYALPFVTLGGSFVGYQSLLHKDEIETSMVQNQLGGYLKSIEKYVLPGEYGERLCVEIEKTKQTRSEYPRKAPLPKNRPLR